MYIDLKRDLKKKKKLGVLSNTVYTGDQKSFKNYCGPQIRTESNICKLASQLGEDPN